LGKKNHTYI